MKSKLLLFLLCPVALTAQASPNTAVLQELVSEVRQLRQALERSATTNVRMQLLLQRMQLQNQRVNQAASRLDSLRGRIAQSLAEQADSVGMARALPDRISQEQDPVRRRDMEAQVEVLKVRLEHFALTEAQLRGQEGELDSALQREQAAWEELLRQLATLEQSFTPNPRP